MDPTARLIAIEDIKQLKARYFRFVDTQDFDKEFREDLKGSGEGNGFLGRKIVSEEDLALLDRE